MKDEEGFFYPHNVDFRGRAYPMHPYLNHLGSDMCRGALEFAEGRALGKTGLRWLKIHVANLYAGGVDKLSLEGRLAFTENNLDEIYDSVDKPLEGRCWWLNAEDPFQCLAVCIELAEAMRSPCPEAYISHIPVHQASKSMGFYSEVILNAIIGKVLTETLMYDRHYTAHILEYRGVLYCLFLLVKFICFVSKSFSRFLFLN